MPSPTGRHFGTAYRERIMEPTGLTIFVLVVLVLAVILVFMGVKSVPQGREYTVERFGRYTKTLRPGLNLIVPIVDGIGAKLNMMEQVLDVPSQEEDEMLDLACFDIIFEIC